MWLYCIFYTTLHILLNNTHILFWKEWTMIYAMMVETNGTGIFLLVVTGAVATLMSVVMRNMIHRYTPHKIDASRFDCDEWPECPLESNN